MVSEPTDEGEEAEQRQITVLHIQPSALGSFGSPVLRGWLRLQRLPRLLLPSVYIVYHQEQQ